MLPDFHTKFSLNIFIISIYWYVFFYIIIEFTFIFTSVIISRIWILKSFIIHLLNKVSIPMKNILVGVYIFRVCTKMNMIQNGFWQKIVLRVYLYKCIYTYTKYYFQSFLFQFPRRGSSTRLCVVGFPRRYCKTFLFQDWWNHLKESRMVLFKALGLSREFNSKD